MSRLTRLWHGLVVAGCLALSMPVFAKGNTSEGEILNHYSLEKLDGASWPEDAAVPKGWIRVSGRLVRGGPRR